MGPGDRDTGVTHVLCRATQITNNFFNPTHESPSRVLGDTKHHMDGLFLKLFPVLVGRMGWGWSPGKYGETGRWMDRATGPRQQRMSVGRWEDVLPLRPGLPIRSRCHRAAAPVVPQGPAPKSFWEREALHVQES